MSAEGPALLGTLFSKQFAGILFQEEKLMPRPCQGCPHYEQCKSHACAAETRHVVDINGDVQIIAHEALSVECATYRKRAQLCSLNPLSICAHVLSAHVFAERRIGLSRAR